MACKCCKKPLVLVETDSIKFHSCHICKKQVDPLNPQFSMFACYNLARATKPVDSNSSNCTKCFWDKVIWEKWAYVENGAVKAENAAVFRRNRMSQEYNCRPTKCQFCDWVGSGNAAR